MWRCAPGDAGYPSCLGDLDGDLPRLFGVGDQAGLASSTHDTTVTIVGARRASAYGLRIAEQLAFDVAAAGLTVVSGMALGIDAAAHRGALRAGGPTIAVLANGPDVAYPSSHRRLHEQIRAERGRDLRVPSRAALPESITSATATGSWRRSGRWP